MRKFLATTILYAMALGVCTLAVLMLANGNTDPFYLRFTTPRKTGLIIGSSRPAQALMPSLIAATVPAEDPLAHLYNFSFTLVHSPFGPTYLEAIRQKMDPAARGAAHVIAVEPWSICSDREAPNDPQRFKEKDLCLGTTPWMNMDPNIPYLLRSYKDPIIDIVVKHFEANQTFLHDDGWLEVTSGLTPAQQNERRKSTLIDYRAQARNDAFSMVRFGYLIETIQLLSTTGQVYLVRLPTSPQFHALEDSLMPGFDDRMLQVAGALHVPYINYTDSLDRFSYSDGSHVDRASAERISTFIGPLLRSRRTQARGK